VTLASDTARRAWIATLAHAPRAQLLGLSADAVGQHLFETLREPEVGLAMVRARSDAAGDRFNLGEATLTRCVVRLRQGVPTPSVGVGYCLGRDAPRARRMAELDAMLQQPLLYEALQHGVLQPLQAALAAQRRAEAARAAATKVDFYTLQPERA
jgi:alpha-D-ribose 1-methylphosphonate 5-triphosphate synthase subunit PhnG